MQGSIWISLARVEALSLFGTEEPCLGYGSVPFHRWDVGKQSQGDGLEVELDAISPFPDRIPKDSLLWDSRKEGHFCPWLSHPTGWPSLSQARVR